jgi:hypothetical protein
MQRTLHRIYPINKTVSNWNLKDAKGYSNVNCLLLPSSRTQRHILKSTAKLSNKEKYKRTTHCVDLPNNRVTGIPLFTICTKNG